MCFFGGGGNRATNQSVAPAPRRDPNQTLAQNAAVQAAEAKGVQDTIFSSPLGDPDFGKYLRKATLLGETA